MKRKRDENIKINVGGKIFETKCETLTQRVVEDEDHFLKKCVEDDNFTKDYDKDGNLFIDRSYDKFEIILEFLRNSCNLDKLFEKEENVISIIDECPYYGLFSLQKLLIEGKSIPPNEDKNKFIWLERHITRIKKYPELDDISKTDVFEMCEKLNEISNRLTISKVTTLSGNLPTLLNTNDYLFNNTLKNITIYGKSYTSKENTVGNPRFLITGSTVTTDNCMFRIKVNCRLKQLTRKVKGNKPQIPNIIKFGIVKYDVKHPTSAPGWNKNVFHYNKHCYVKWRFHCQHSGKGETFKITQDCKHEWSTTGDLVTLSDKPFILSVVLENQHILFYKDEKEVAKVDYCGLDHGYRFYVGLKGYCSVEVLDLEDSKQTEIK